MFKWLRLLVFLRRIAIALERANSLKEQGLALEHPQWAREHSIKVNRPHRKVEFSRATADAINKRWADSHPDEEL